MAKQRITTPAFRAGDRQEIKTTIMLSAPGQAEEKLGRPAAGQTGMTLQKALKYLHAQDPSIFPSDRLDDYTILNAVETIHYHGKTGRTEGNSLEINDQKNIERINESLSDTKTVLALGSKARIAVGASKFCGAIFHGEHPSMQALNRKFVSEKSTPAERSAERIMDWSLNVLSSKSGS